jgi:hypothetical protein
VSSRQRGGRQAGPSPGPLRVPDRADQFVIEGPPAPLHRQVMVFTLASAAVLGRPGKPRPCRRNGELEFATAGGSRGGAQLCESGGVPPPTAVRRTSAMTTMLSR